MEDRGFKNLRKFLEIKRCLAEFHADSNLDNCNQPTIIKKIVRALMIWLSPNTDCQL